MNKLFIAQAIVRCVRMVARNAKSSEQFNCEPFLRWYHEAQSGWQARANDLTVLLLVPDPQPTSAPARIRQVSAAVEVASLPVTSDDPSGLADEFAAIEIEMVASGKFIMVEIEGKTTLFPLRPMVFDCADDGYSFVSGGLF